MKVMNLWQGSLARRRAFAWRLAAVVPCTGRREGWRKLGGGYALHGAGRDTVEKDISRATMRRQTKTQALAVLGLFISLYALDVELNMDEDPDYEALCDISAKCAATLYRPVCTRAV